MRRLIQLCRCFLGQVPIAVILFVAAAWGLPSEVLGGEEMECHSDHAPTTAAKLSRMDFLGLITFILTMATFLLVLSFAERGFPGNHVVILSLGAACITSGILFIIIEGFVAKEPLIPLGLLRSNGVGVIALVQVLVMLARWSVSMIPVALFSVKTG